MGSRISDVFADKMENLIVAVRSYPVQDPDVIYPESILQDAVAIGIRRFSEMSRDHCNNGGKLIYI